MQRAQTRKKRQHIVGKGRVAISEPHCHERATPATYARFLRGDVSTNKAFTFVSLFSGAGIGDYGLKLAGGLCLGACEIDPHRRAVHEANIAAEKLWSDIREDAPAIAAHFAKVAVDLVMLTPPCQSFSTANARRGNRELPDDADKDHRNGLFFVGLEVVKAIRPKVIVFENVPNFLERLVRDPSSGEVGRIQDLIELHLRDYVGITLVTCFSKLGIPQRRKRALAIYVLREMKWSAQLLDQVGQPEKWGGKLSRAPRTLAAALAAMEPLDGTDPVAATSKKDILHSVPSYTPTHYRWIDGISSGSGQSAWENNCESCGAAPLSLGEVICSSCGNEVETRPHVRDANGFRPIRGYKTSYRRMAPDDLAPTVTTASGHFSSDLKLHPFENRVLSARECALLQTVPLSFNFPEAQRMKRNYLVRVMIGEAVPTLVSYRLAKSIAAYV
ncbi:DNA cytosine methyltransferase [Stenotrophomonas lactitubi]|uniref:DNA cytosine methyltransferase n=1 Tax=Stenotrophomonas lactitubi TaxID=2045214 RepID=UPI001D36FAD6|nr:DNA cytosine methyltransferase [Stenotrophomonas lactitubi]CAH0244664.1 putative BsuMI modification methylase subunit YdiO [Stenotrophomonas lactitubi]